MSGLHPSIFLPYILSEDGSTQGLSRATQGVRLEYNLDVELLLFKFLLKFKKYF